MTSSLKFIDLFCGIGGFHTALKDLGCECVFACDIDKDCRDVYNDNYGIEPSDDIRKVKEEEIPDFDVLCAGFPCQAFSHSGKQLGFEETRGTLFFEICRIVKCKQPKFLILENVKNLYGHNDGKTWNTIRNSIVELGYKTYEKPIVINPLHLGVPQNRDRVFIIGVREDVGELPPYPSFAKKQTSLLSILENDDQIELAIKSKVNIKPDVIEVLDIWDEFIQYFKSIKKPLPSFPVWTECWKSEIPKDLPDWKEKFMHKNKELYTENKDFLDTWLAKAVKTTRFQGAMTKFEWQCGAAKDDDSIWNLIFQFRPSGIRVKRDDYSPALVAMTQIVNVGCKKRQLTPREAARLQSFPETFKMHSNVAKAYKQFGNSVNVEVVKTVAKMLINHTY